MHRSSSLPFGEERGACPPVGYHLPGLEERQIYTLRELAKAKESCLFQPTEMRDWQVLYAASM